jgi:hypothetical protein
MIAKQRLKKPALRSMSSKSCLSSRLLRPICKNGITCDVAVGSHYGKRRCKKKAYRATLAHPMSLALLLMKAGSSKNPVTGRYAISPYRGLSDRRISLCQSWVAGSTWRQRSRYLLREIRTFPSFISLKRENGGGQAYCTELLGERMSIWEVQALRKSEREQAKEAEVVSLENRQRIQQEAAGGRRLHSPSDKTVRETTTDGSPTPGNSSRTGPNDLTCAGERPVCTYTSTRAERRACACHSRRWCASAFCCPGADTEMEEH